MTSANNKTGPFQNISSLMLQEKDKVIRGHLKRFFSNLY